MAVRRSDLEQTWERYPPEAPAGTLENLIKGIFGVTVDESRRAVEERTKALAAKVSEMPELKAHGGQPKNQNASKNKNEPREHDVGFKDDNLYKTRRIKRDAPEVYEKMLDGEYPSVEQAAVAAGIKKPSNRWNAPKDVEKLAVFLKERYPPEQRKQIRELLWV